MTVFFGGVELQSRRPLDHGQRSLLSDNRRREVGGCFAPGTGSDMMERVQVNGR